MDLKYKFLLLALFSHAISGDIKVKSYHTGEECRAGKVVGGADAQAETWYPSVVHLNDTECGATIVNEVWLLTAAHCYVEYGARVVAGNPFKCADAKYEQIRKVSKIFKHEEHQPNPLHFNDIALLQIDRPFKFTPAVQPVKLIHKQYNFPDDTLATAVGWGVTSLTFRGPQPRSSIWEEEPDPSNQTVAWQPKRLQEVDVPSVRNETCRAILEDSGDKFHPGMICFGYLEFGGKDTCQGDSGGPLYATETPLPPSKSPSKDHFLIGITSFGYGCARPRKPGFYTRVQYYLDWIEKTIERNPYKGIKSPASRAINVNEKALGIFALMLTWVFCV